MYIGSVRFFKNMILLVIVVIISTLLFFVYKFYSVAAHYERMLLCTYAAGNVIEEEILPMGRQHPFFEGLSAEKPHYQELYPDFYAEKNPHPVDFKKNTVYLTFDDGPSKCTRELISLLDAKCVKATFFVVGTVDKENLNIMKELAAHGHSIGMHTYSHEYSFIYNTVEDYLFDMHNIFKLIKQTTGHPPEIFRFPGGSINANNYLLYKEIMSEMLRRGFVPYDWNISAGDADTPNITKEQITANIVKHSDGVTRPIILLHDSSKRQSTVSAIGSIIDYYRSKGYEFDKITANTKPVLFYTKYRGGE